MPHRLVFFGTPSFAVPALTALLESGYDIAAVVTAPDANQGRGQTLKSCPVAELARKHNLLVVQPHKLKSPEVIALLQSLGASAGVLVAYGHIIPDAILHAFARGIVNIHPSLLPKYRGSSPISSCLLNGDTETGITLMQLDEEMDHGPIISQQIETIGPQDTSQTLHDRLAKIGAQILIKKLPEYLAGEIIPEPQDHSLASYTKMIKSEDGLINWGESAQHIYRSWQAYQPWPGVFTAWQGKRLKFGHLEPLEGVFSGPVGLCLDHKGGIAIICGQGAVRPTQLQLEGGKMLEIADFLRGHSKIVGQVVGA